MASKIFTRSTALAFNMFKGYSTTSKLVDVSFNDKTGVATVSMQRAPVNALNLELLSELQNTIEDLETKKLTGMILTSSLNTIFSGGLDIMEMYKPNSERVKTFWIALQDTWIALYNTPYPTVAAINGHSPAGGCLLAMCCEYRIMVNKFTIGLNETKLGIVAPFWFISTMNNTIGSRASELALTAGKLFTTEEALNVGLIDEIASDKANALLQAENFFKRFNGIHPLARSLTKQEIRGKLIEELQQKKEEDVERFLFFVQQPAVQKGLEIYIQSLKKK